jgi:hypothetical protein
MAAGKDEEPANVAFAGSVHIFVIEAFRGGVRRRSARRSAY